MTSSDHTKCLECSVDLSSRTALKWHLRKHHDDMTFESYVVKHEHDGARPTCSCGCGGELRFDGIHFATLIKGHVTQAMRDAQSCRRKGVKATHELRAKMSAILSSSPAVKVAAKLRSDKMREFYASDRGDRLRIEQSMRGKAFNGSHAGIAANERRKATLNAYWKSEEGVAKRQHIGGVVKAWTASDSGRETLDARSIRMREFYATPEGKQVLVENGLKISERRRLPFDEVERRMIAVHSNTTLVLSPPVTRDSYVGLFMDVTVSCSSCGGIQTRLLNSIMLAPRCMLCDRQTTASVGQAEVADMLRATGHDVILSNWTTIAPYELDIVVPTKGLAVEYHGQYWHSELCTHDSGRTTRKRRLAGEAGLDVVTIFDDEWRDRRSIVESMLRYRLGIAGRRLFARKCSIVVVDQHSRCAFFDENHISGDVKARHAFGLTCDGELVAVMSLRIPLTKKHGDRLDVARFAVARDTAVIGALSRLTKHAFEQAKVDGKVGLVSYADRRFSRRGGHEAVGYRFSHETKPRFWWTDLVNRHDRFSIRASGSESESDVASRLGMYRVFGDTNDVYLFDG